MNSLSIFTRIQDVQRLRQIFTVLARHGYGHFVEKLGLRDSRVLGIILPQPSTQTASNPERFRQVLEELGPTFVKFGQILSTRPDLIPPSYTDEFSMLQDNVPPFPFEEVEDQVRIELGAEIRELFQSFDSKPVASASLAQVHRGNLKDGTQVAVKVQRPGIKPLIESDIDLLYLLARMTERSIPELSLYTPKKVVREFERAIMRELDFTIEAANAERFRTNFNGNSDIYFPGVYNELSGKRILTMDFVEGVKITDTPLFGYDPKLIARLGLRAVVEMIFRDGFFHADPHPGNVFVMEGGRLAYLDLGLAGRVREEVRDKMLLLLLAITREDFEEVAQIFYKIGIKEDEVDMSEFRADVIDICEKHFGKPLKYMELGAFIKDIIEGSFRHRIRIPYEYALMCKALITMEGVGKKLDPDINIFKESHPYLVEIFKKRYNLDRASKDLTKTLITLSSVIREAPPQIKGILDSFESGRLKVRVEDSGAEKRAIRWETIINRLIITLLISTLVLASLFLILFGKSAWATFFSILGFFSAGFLGFWLMISILRSGKF
ncbi:MAG: AarF/ABC1/UbiB kinase family protein [Deltaproteobacteria bacterium]|nr:AarF/ABC1/UbiB kinase family protein [Deltaproteobacteria bacterium]